MAILPFFFKRRKKQHKGLGIEPVPMPYLKRKMPDFGVLSRTVDIFRKRFAEMEATNYAIAHAHLRRRDMFDARRCFSRVAERNASREDACYYLALSQLWSRGKHSAIGASALRRPAENGFPSYAEEAAYALAVYEDDSFIPFRPPFSRIAEQEQLLTQYAQETFTFINEYEPGVPLLPVDEDMTDARGRPVNDGESAFLYANTRSEDDAAMFLVNLMSEYALPERTARTLLLGDTGAAYAYMERKDIVPDITRAILPAPLPALIGSSQEAFKRAGRVISSFTDVNAPEGGYNTVICPTLCRYFARPADMFNEMQPTLAPRALIVFTLALADDDDADLLFYPNINMFAAGENTWLAMLKEDGYEYIKTARFTRRGRDMRRLLCVYRMPRQQED